MSESRKNLYPVYLVHDIESAFKIKYTNSFYIADMLFRKPSLNLEPANQEMEFHAYTEGDEFIFRMRYAKLGEGQNSEMTLLFDPDCSRRKRKNAFQFRIQDNGRLEYDEYRYEIETLPLPFGVNYSYNSDDSAHTIHITIPFSLLRIKSNHYENLSSRVLGFNVFRTIRSQGDKQILTWAGIKGDKTDVGQGTGILLLTRGLTVSESEEMAERLGAEADFYYTAWVKRKVPAEIYEFLSDKKTGLTVRMNAEDVRLARENAEQTRWGNRTKQEILAIADYWAAKSDDELHDLVPFGNPRAMSVGQSFGDPLTGGRRTAFQVCLEKPYQYYNPSTGTWWHNGMVIQNPTTGEDVRIDDDGRGFLAPVGFPNPGVRYMFTASYRSFLLAMLMSHPYCDVMEDKTVLPETSGDAYAGAIPSLAYAYQLTGDLRYAYKTLLLAGRIAELAPYMNGNYGNAYCDTVLLSEPSTTESHWLSNYFDALDLVYDAIGEVNDDLALFYAGKPDAENHTRTQPFSVKEAIYELIPQVLFSCEVERTRDADWSMRWLHLELIIASFMGSGKLMKHVLYEGRHSLISKMRNSFFRDGRYIYDSMFYIDHICEQMCFMANNNYRFSDDTYFPDGIDMFENAEFGLNQVIRLYVQLRCGNLLPMFGDNGFVDNESPISEQRRKGKITYSPSFEIIYRRMPSLRPVVGQVLAQYGEEELEQYRAETVQWKNKRTLLAKQKHALLLLACATDRKEYLKFVSDGMAIQPSYLLQDSETSVFRSGTNSHNCKHVILYGQPSAGHMHGDKLGLWIGAYGYHLLAGAGGYPSSWVSPKWQAWEVQAAACTVVVVDGKDQQISYSRLKCHYEGSLLQVSGMENLTANPGTHSERWCWVVQAPNRADAYVLDMNLLAKGGTFDYNTLGLDISFDQIAFGGIAEEDWVPMQGTLAGPDIPLYSKPGYGWMKAVRKASVNRSVTWTFDYGEAALKIHTVPRGESREIICSLGERGGKEMGKSRWEPFVMWRDGLAEESGKDSHTAAFVTVLEPYEHKPFLNAVLPLQYIDGNGRSDFHPFGAEIQYSDGYKDILIGTYSEGEFASFRDTSGREYRTDAQSLLLRYHGEQLTAVEAVRCSFVSAGSYVLKKPHPVYRGTISAIDLDTSGIHVELDQVYEDFPLALEGLVALIDSPDYVKPSSYYMLNPQIDGKTFSFRSDMTLLKLETDWKAPHKRRGLGNKQAVERDGAHIYVDVKTGDSFQLFNTIKEQITGV